MPAHPPSLQFSHLGLYVHDLPRMAAFYQRVLGFTQTDQGFLPTADPAKPVELVFLSGDPEEHHQIVLASGRPREAHFNVVNQISLRAASLDDLQHRHRQIEAEVAGGHASNLVPITHGNAISIYFSDPEGNRLEFFIDTPWYVSQPIRVPIDLKQPPAEVLAWAEKHARGLDGFCAREEWVERMRVRMQAAKSTG